MEAGGSGDGDRAGGRPGSDRGGRPDARVWAAAAAVLLLTVVAYEGVRGLGFVSYDDPGYVASNPQVQRGLDPVSVAWAFRATDMANWHPLTWLSHMAVWQVAGGAPAAHHGASLLLHAVNALLLFAVLWRATGATGPSAFAAALFAVHPLHVESVAWVAERKDVLSTFFALIATGAYLRFASGGGRGAHALALGALVAGLLCKPMLVTLPFAFLLLDVWPLGRMRVGPGASTWDRLPRLVAEKLPMLAVVAAFSVLTYVVQRDYGAVKGLGDMAAGERVANAILAYGTYLRQTFWPTGLAVFYPHPDAFPPLRVAAVALGLVALTAGAWRAAPRLPFLLVGWLWFLGTLVPVIGLVQVGLQAHADRYTYLPHIGLFAALAWGADALRRRLRVPAWGAAAGAAAILLVLVALTRAQVAVWRDDVSLFRHALAVTGPNHVAHFFLGERARARGAWEEAAGHLERSIALHATTPVVHNNLGNVRAAQGRPEEAMARYREALRLAPGYAEARSNLGALLLREGRVDEAVAELRRAAQEAPGSPAARLNLGAALLAAGEPAEALPQYREVLALAEARGDVPTAQQARRTLAGLLAAHPDPALRDGEEALRLAERALAVEPAGHPVDLDHLAQAQAELGRFDRAIPLTLQALQRVPPEHADFADALRERLEGYREGRPYRLDPSSFGAGEAGSSM